MRALLRSSRDPSGPSRLAAVALSLFVLLGAASCGRAPENEPAATASSGGVELRLRAVDGRELSLSSLRGKVVLVDVFATWCGPCLQALPGLARLSKARPDDLVVVGILVNDEPRNLATLLQRNPLPYFCGVGGAEATRLFPTPALPTVYVINREGRIVDRVVGLVPESELMRKAQAHL